MSFSASVRKEISEFFANRHCKVAELSAIINICGKLCKESGILQIRCENEYLRKRFLEFCADIALELDFVGNVAVLQSHACQKLLHITKISKLGSTNEFVLKNECCKKAYIRGMYLACGNLSNPQNSYHMEFKLAHDMDIEPILEVFGFFGLSPKLLCRKNIRKLYFKDSEQISTVLNIMNAHVSLMEFENLRITKEVNSAINRSTNFSTANADRVISASAKHIRDITAIQSTMGLGGLPLGLQEIASARLAMPLASLSELGDSLQPPISKYGVNHRLRKISQIAEKL